MPRHFSECGCKPKRLVEMIKAAGGKIGTLYETFGVSRATAYRVWSRFTQGGDAALVPSRRGPKPGGQRWSQWSDAVLALRRRWPSFGPRKLRHLLRRDYPRQRMPSERTIARILSAAGCVRRRRRRGLGPIIERAKLTQARRSNAVWTIDFKGYFYTADGQRCLPLTVRDLFSRYLLAVEHVTEASDLAVRRVLCRCFRRYGLPGVIRVDNGTPFSGEGPRGLTSLSVWWVRLGIRVEFTRPAKPQDNGAHEQMHGVLKRETAQPPAADLPAQARRFRRFCQCYNEVRPHEKLRMRVPATVYRPQPIRIPKLKDLRYPASWERKRVSQAGLIYWAGKMRIVGRPFKGQYVGLKPMTKVAASSDQAAEVYLGSMLLGELHASDPAALRPVRYPTKSKRRSP